MLDVKTDLPAEPFLAFGEDQTAEEIEVAGSSRARVGARRRVLEEGVIGEPQSKVDLLVQLVVERLPIRMKDGDRTILEERRLSSSRPGIELLKHVVRACDPLLDRSDVRAPTFGLRCGGRVRLGIGGVPGFCAHRTNGYCQDGESAL